MIVFINFLYKLTIASRLQDSLKWRCQVPPTSQTVTTNIFFLKSISGGQLDEFFGLLQISIQRDTAIINVAPVNTISIVHVAAIPSFLSLPSTNAVLVHRRGSLASPSGHFFRSVFALAVKIESARHHPLRHPTSVLHSS